jgi:hypothetical protein
MACGWLVGWIDASLRRHSGWIIGCIFVLLFLVSAFCAYGWFFFGEGGSDLEGRYQGEDDDSSFGIWTRNWFMNGSGSEDV